MSKPMVLVIHGMGTHKPGNTKSEITKGINDTAKHFGLNEFKFEDEVEFFQFNYSEFFDEVRLKSAEKAGSIIDHITLLKGLGLGETAALKLQQFISELDENEFFNTHWLDVIYYGLMHWGEKIRVDLAVLLNKLLIEQQTYNRKLHIISHSLGTSVLHDTLAKLYRKDPDLSSKVPQLDVDSYKLDSIWTIANVSRLLNLLNDIADPNHSTVISGPSGCAKLMYNIRNEFDPFTWIKRYDRDIPDGSTVTIETIRKLNTHDLAEYMAAPETCYLVLANILDLEVSDSAFADGVKKYGETAINKPYEDVKAQIDILKNKPSTSDGINAVKQLIESVEELKQSIQAMLKS